MKKAQIVHVLDRSCLTDWNQLCHAPFCYMNPVKFAESCQLFADFYHS